MSIAKNIRTASHITSREEAKAYVDRFKTNSESEIVGGLFSRSIFDQILAQEGVVSIRYYYGMKEDDTPCIVFVGVDKDGREVNGLYGQDSWPCPPFCSPDML